MFLLWDVLVVDVFLVVPAAYLEYR
jgi:hypothetical protein